MWSDISLWFWTAFIYGDHFFIYLAFVYLLWRNVHLSLLSIFKLGCYCSVIGILYIFWIIKPLPDDMIYTSFLSFHFLMSLLCICPVFLLFPVCWVSCLCFWHHIHYWNQYHLTFMLFFLPWFYSFRFWLLCMLWDKDLTFSYQMWIPAVFPTSFVKDSILYPFLNLGIFAEDNLTWSFFLISILFSFLTCHF